MSRKANKAGSSRVVTRAANRVVVPAINPGSLDNVRDGRSRLYQQLQAMCTHYASKKIPKFSANTQPLDRWLLDQIDEEKTGYLAGMIDQAAMIQSNLHYRLIGSRPLVSRTLDILHNSEGGDGFRSMLRATALNFYCSNFGAAVYLNRSEPVIPSYLPNIDKWYWSTPPVDSLYATDPTQFSSNWDYVYPYSYNGELFSRYDFFRIVSMPSTRLDTWGIGRCALWRCIQIARLTSALYTHVYDSLSPDAAKGVLTIKGLSVEEFLQAMNGSEAVNEQDDVQRDGHQEGDGIGDIVVLADRDEEITVKFVTLSRIPDGLFVDGLIRNMLSSIAVNLGYPLDEFLGSSSNQLLGQSGDQVQQNATRAISKGGSDFSSQFQYYMQAMVVPETVQFEFANRDIDSELQDVQLKQAKVDIVTQLFEAVQLAIINKGEEASNSLIEAKATGQHIITREEARRLLSEWGVVSWLSEDVHPDVVLNDTNYDLSTYRLKLERDKVRDTPAIKRLADNPMGEPVILYENWIDKSTGFERARQVTLWENDSDLNKANLWTGLDFDGTKYDEVGPNIYKRRAITKKITLDLVLDSQHARDITRIVRRLLLASIEYLNNDLSLDGYQEISTLASKKDTDNFVSKLYAIVQLGRDAALERRKISDTYLAELAGASIDHARKRWGKLQSEMDGEVKRLIDVALQEHHSSAQIILDPKPSIMAQLDEFLKIRAGEISEAEVTAAFELGQNLVYEITGFKAEAIA